MKIGSYEVDVVLGSLIAGRVFDAMTAPKSDAIAIPADTPCGKRVQELFYRFGRVRSALHTADLFLSELSRELKVERKFAAEDMREAIDNRVVHLGRETLEVATIYMERHLWKTKERIISRALHPKERAKPSRQRNRGRRSR